MISIIIPTYNEGSMLSDAINSALNQTYKELEIIVVNDGSTDAATLEVLQNLPNAVKVIHQDNHGAPAARNCGIQASSGEYLLVVDADDTLQPTYLEETLAVMQANQDIDIVNTCGNYFGLKEGQYEKQDYNPYVLAWENIVGNSALVTRKALLAVDGYTDPLERYDDWDLWLKLVHAGYKWKLLPKHLLNYRVRSGSRSDKAKAAYEQHMRTLLAKHKEFFQKNYEGIYLAGRSRWYLEHKKNQVS